MPRTQWGDRNAGPTDLEGRDQLQRQRVPPVDPEVIPYFMCVVRMTMTSGMRSLVRQCQVGEETVREHRIKKQAHHNQKEEAVRRV